MTKVNAWIRIFSNADFQTILDDLPHFTETWVRIRRYHLFHRANMRFSIVLSISAAVLFASLASAQPEPVVFSVGRLYPVSGPPIDKAVLVVQNGKIIAVGKQGGFVMPKEADVFHNLPDAVIVPGFVDTHSHIGIWPRPNVPAHSDGNEMSGPVQPALRAIDAILPDDPGIRMAVAGGITTANIMPGSGNVIGGQTVYVKLRGQTIDQMRIKDDKTLGGLKMANGENPKNYGKRGQAPFTRMKIAALQREQFIKAREYRQKWQRYRDDAKDGKANPPEIDLSMEPLVEVLDRKRTVHFHCHRADDLLTAIRIAEEFDFDLVIQHGTEGYRIAEELARKKIPVSLTLVDSPGGKLEVMSSLEENAAILDKAGVLVAVNTDDSITESRFFLRTAAIAMRGGLSEEAALRTLTINGAKMLRLDHRIGSLEKGKDADFVVLSGSPFSVYTQVLSTYIDGVKHFDRTSKRDWTYQAGGFALTNLDKLPAIHKLVKPLPPVKDVAINALDDPMKTMKAFAIRAGRIHTASGKPILDGVIIVEDGKIKSVGTADEIAIPQGMPVIGAREATPGLIDAHSVCGLSGAFNVPADQDQDETSDPNQSDLRVIDGFNPNDPHLEFLRANGVTTIHALPGRHSVIAGQSGIFHTSGTTVNQALIRFPAGLLVNLGEAVKKEGGKSPHTRMASAGIVRSAFSQARGHLAKKDDPKTTRNQKHESLQPMLNGTVPVIFSAHRADDIVTGLRLAEEFKLRPILSLATEAYLIPETIAASKAPVIVHPTMQRAAGSMETLNGFTGNAAVLADQKVLIAISTAFEGYVPKTRMLRSEAGIALTHGLGHERALRAVTIDAARLLGIDKEYGSIEPGKAADLVLFDGEPFENTSHVAYTIIGGKVVYSRGEYLKLPFSRRALALTETGGIGCCMGQW
jgi:imidazolonepropionase-like amidohydrolase